MSMVGQTKEANFASQPAATRQRMRLHQFVRTFSRASLLYLLLLGGAVVFTLPFLWMVSTSLKLPENVFTFPPQWIPNPVRFVNYAEGWNRLPFTQFAINTTFITVHNAVADTIISSLVAYGFARLRAPGKGVLFMLVLATMMVPLEVTRVPLYILFSRLGWVNTFLPLIITSWFGWPFFIFLMRQFIASIPYDLDDAARMDGCSTFGIWWRIILPLSKPALAAVAIFSFVGNWNDFQGPLIYLSDIDKYTLALGLRMMQGGRFIFIHQVMAVSVVSVMPILIIFFSAQRYFIQGVTLSGIKG